MTKTSECGVELPRKPLLKTRRSSTMHATHPNATLTPVGRLKLARLVIDKGWTLARAAERFSVGVTTARRWAERYRLLGAAGMLDRSSRPHRCPHQLTQRT